MKATIISNGTVRIALEGENDMERAALKHLAKLEIRITEMDSVQSILNEKVLEGSVIIETKSSSGN